MREQDFQRALKSLYRVLIVAMVTLLLVVIFGGVAYLNPELLKRPEITDQPSQEAPKELVVADGEWIEDEHKLLVVANCTGCHSAKLVTQNRATREGWRNMIRWMQETQNLKDLGPDEEKILDYLSKNYAPAEQGRRGNLKVEEWYALD